MRMKDDVRRGAFLADLSTISFASTRSSNTLSNSSALSSSVLFSSATTAAFSDPSFFIPPSLFAPMGSFSAAPSMLDWFSCLVGGLDRSGGSSSMFNLCSIDNSILSKVDSTVCLLSSIMFSSSTFLDKLSFSASKAFLDKASRSSKSAIFRAITCTRWEILSASFISDLLSSAMPLRSAFIPSISSSSALMRAIQLVTFASVSSRPFSVTRVPFTLAMGTTPFLPESVATLML
mmetsp:Transcript_55798/g.167224  ORF Transcript_55798/g.167224 Transcript_55798/m.167224 type:complete len:234 (-) Transcript_55798:877-1578(-)